MCRYDWQQTDKMAMDNMDTLVEYGENTTNVSWKARTYLIITGQAGRVTLPGNVTEANVQFGEGFTQTLHPSYDIKINSSYSKLN